MKKITIVSLFSLLFLTISSVVAYSLKYTNITNLWIFFIVGVIILVTSGIVNLVFSKKKWLDAICFISNAISLGFLIRTWYMYREFDNPLWIMLLVSVACLVYLIVFYLALYIPFIERHYEIYLLIFIIVTLIAYITIIFTTKTTFVSTFGYYLIIEIAFIFAMSTPAKTFNRLFRNIVVSTYSVFVVAIILLLILLSEDGSGLDACGDFVSGLGVSSPKNDKVKKSKYY